VIFREICARDIEELLDVRAATRENAIPRQRLAQMGITPTSVGEGLASGATKGWVCSWESRIVGFCMGDWQRGEVLVLAVLPEAEGRGIGKTLLSLVIEWLSLGMQEYGRMVFTGRWAGDRLVRRTRMATRSSC
jgi:ribosomal protein S18 acetylase RimI-like enzyme